jgi:hypothetical protein
VAAVVAVVVAASCSGGGGGGEDVDLPTVERQEQPLPAWVNAPQGLGDTLVAERRPVGDPEYRIQAVVSSVDAGASWQEVALPGAPEPLDLAPLVVTDHEAGGVALVEGRDLVPWFESLVHGEEHYLWASTDGRAWHGGRIGVDVPAGGSDAYAVEGVGAAGGVLVAGVTAGTPGDDGDVDRFELVRSVDGGVTWATADTPDLATTRGETGRLERLVELEPGRLVAYASPRAGNEYNQVTLESTDAGATWRPIDCPTLQGDTCEHAAVAGDLLLGDEWASTDGGRTWQPLEVETDLCSPEAIGDGACFGVSRPVALPGGGWLGSTVDGEGRNAVVRSTDGAHWRQVDPPEACLAADRSATDRDASSPVALGDGWLVAYDCPGADGTRSELQALSPDATAARTVPGTSRHGGERYGEPTPLGDDVMVPVLGGEPAVAAIVRVTP